MQKRKYSEPEMEALLLQDTDVIRTSGDPNNPGSETPDDEF